VDLGRGCGCGVNCFELSCRSSRLDISNAHLILSECSGKQIERPVMHGGAVSKFPAIEAVV